jgi:hypothetical protein
VKFDIGDCTKICRGNKNLFKTEQKYWGTLHEDSVLVIVAGDIKSSQNRSLRMKPCQDGRTAEEVDCVRSVMAHGDAREEK